MKHIFARQLRREQTNVERKLWFALRGRRFHTVKFRRQQPIGPYIVDFVSFEARLIIELEGGQHSSAEGLARDAVRTRRLEEDGFRTIRFPNHEVNENFEGVLDGIALALGRSLCPLTLESAQVRRFLCPLPQGERDDRDRGGFSKMIEIRYPSAPIVRP